MIIGDLYQSSRRTGFGLIWNGKPIKEVEARYAVLKEG